MSDLYRMKGEQMIHLQPYYPKIRPKPRVDDRRCWAHARRKLHKVFKAGPRL